MRGVVGLASGRRGLANWAGSGRGAADQRTAAGGADVPSAHRLEQAVIVLGEEDESAQGIVDLGAEEMKTTAGRGGAAKHVYAHPAREADTISWARWDLLGDK